MSLSEMKRLHESGDWVCYHNHMGEWDKTRRLPDGTHTIGTYVIGTNTKLIHKRHEKIADRVIADDSVKVEIYNGIKFRDILTGFFSEYNYREHYRIKENWNNGYIIASEEAYALLIEAGYKAERDYIDLEFDCILMQNNKLSSCSKEYITILNKDEKRYKQFYINNGKLSWEKPEVEPSTGNKEYNGASYSTPNTIFGYGSIDTEDFITECKEMCEILEGKEEKSAFHRWKDKEHITGEEYESLRLDERWQAIIKDRARVAEFEALEREEEKMDTISITDSEGVEYVFEKPKFKCELFKIIGDGIFGYTEQEGQNIATTWDKEGEANFAEIWTDDYNLTPIKPWHEDKSNFPFMIRDQVSPYSLKVAHSYADVNWDIYRLATKDEILEGLYYDE